MIVKIMPSGKSFKGLAAYLTHDPKANTAERVAWTHTLNLANDHVPSAVNEMVWTARNAELLKQESGVRAGGRSTEHPVKHVSLNWAIEDNPSERHMIATGEQFMRSMGWNERQAIFVAHSDKKYKHLHIIINEVHPETGLKLNDAFEQVRAQEWAANYEREQGVIRCEQRLKSPEEREKNMPRNLWVEFRKNEQEFSQAEEVIAKNSSEIPENSKNAEWKILKEFQQAERKEFFAQGKIEFAELRSSIYREVREEFREKWSEYYNARKNGTEPELLGGLKAQIIADQKAVLEPRRDEACRELRESRNERYRGLLDQQRDDRAELRWRQDAGLDNAPFLSNFEERRNAAVETGVQFREAGREITAHHVPDRGAADRAFDTRHDEPTPASGQRGSEGMRVRVFGVGSFLDSLFVDLTGPGPRPPEPDPDAFRSAAEEAAKQKQPTEYRSYDDEWRARERSLYGRD